MRSARSSSSFTTTCDDSIPREPELEDMDIFLVNLYAAGFAPPIPKKIFIPTNQIPGLECSESSDSSDESEGSFREKTSSSRQSRFPRFRKFLRRTPSASSWRTGETYAFCSYLRSTANCNEALILTINTTLVSNSVIVALETSQRGREVRHCEANSVTRSAWSKR